jgi:hypothetical protein
MRVRSPLDAEHAVLAVLGMGLVSFSLVHSASLFQAGGERTISLFRELWFTGFAVTLVLIVLAYFLGE